MYSILASVLATAFYCLSAFLIFKQLNQSNQKRWVVLAPALLATLLQSILLNNLIYQGEGLNFNFFTTFSLISWLISIQILLSAYFMRIESLGIAIFPISGLASIFAGMDFPVHLISTGDNAIQGHILISIVAYALITLGAFQASLLAYQDHAIRSHHPGGLIRFLPPLYDMESFLFVCLGFGFACLSISLISGFFFLEDIFAQHLVHKTVLSIVAWFILGILMFGRIKFGWRGRKAIRWTLTAFVFLMLAFFGTKLVLEFILQ
ncbi:MAG: cytochrome c biogenesis protein CcsA [Gammaproteobacteria bacterium]|nr:cytochrome c biogenesis protein CcsA [Gammaproteobacteria bacterium]